MNEKDETIKQLNALHKINELKAKRQAELIVSSYKSPSAYNIDEEIK